MKRKKYWMAFAFAGMIGLTGFHVTKDPEFLIRLKEQLSRFNSSYPEEKIYVQFDKPFYKPEEEMWFNATVLNSNTHRPATTSDVLYVELIDPKGNMVSKQEILVTEGTAHGSFQLMESVPGGIYKVKAYTRWARNFGTENFFTKDLTIQKVITPRMLLKLDYEKESYGAGENVKARLSIKNLKNQKVKDATVRLIIRVAGKQLGELKLTSDEKGEANLNFVLPADLKSTDGLLVAIVASNGVEESISRSVPIVLNNIDVQFFPEGGQWFENVSSTIAFKALNEFGKGADIKGSIVDEANHVVVDFESFHMGMGAFKMTPVAGKQYFAQINSPVQRKERIALPAPLESGVSFQLSQHKKSITEWTVVAPAKDECFIVAQIHGEIVHSSSYKIEKGSNTIKINTEQFPAGIAAFTLFDKSGTPRCERLVFVRPEKGLQISVKPEKEFYEPRERVKLKVETKDYNGKPVRAKLSMSVVDDQVISFADDKQDNILSWFMLSSEVKGDIQEPSFYFDREEPKAQQALDYLLMTQGWRRFTWSDINKERAITFAPEKLTTISGRVVDANNNGVDQEVTYIEVGNRKRIAQVKSTSDGYFVIRNIDPSTEVLLMTKRPAEIIIEKGKSMVIEQIADVAFDAGRGDDNAEIREKATEVADAKPESPIVDKEKNIADDGELDLDMDSDVAQLSEVVVVGYGSESRSSLTGALASVKTDQLSGGFTLPSVESALQGRAAGVSVIANGTPSANARILIRGYNSLGSGSEPLFVINGHPIAPSVNNNFSNGSIIAPEDIESIQVMLSPEASAIFGSSAANGAILINTRNKLLYQHNNFARKERQSKYSTLTLSPRSFSPTREFYVPPVKSSSHERQDFRTTVHWAHTLITNDKGTAEVSFIANDAVSSFRITTEGFSGTGLIGRNESVYSTQLPVSIDTKIPQALGFEDVLKLPVMIKNERPTNMSGIVSIELPSALSLNESAQVDLDVPAGETKTIWYTIRPKGIQGTFPIVIKSQFAGVKDQIKQDVIVRSVGFPRTFSVSAKELDNTFGLSIQDAEDNSIQAELNVFPDVLSDLFDGAESILREPYGCFEQVSSSTFPNILALQFMKESGKVTPELETRALHYIRKGYKMLAGYEIRSGGFEWFGHTPAHEGLTGYGLIEFHEMAKVYDGVDAAMVARTREWLLSRKDGKGGFKQSDQGYDTFSGSSASVGNAYILYALSETGSDDLSFEYATAATEAWKSKDMYRLALMANVAYNLGKREDYKKFITYFEQHVSPEGIAVLNAQESMVHSYGNSLRTETLAFWTLALLKDMKMYQPLIKECINELFTYRNFGGFGSTQATILALKVLTEYGKWTAGTRGDGIVEVTVDNKIADRLAFTKDARGTLTASAFTSSLSSDRDHNIRVKFVGSPSPLPYSVDVKWYTRTPLSDPACHVDLKTSIAEPVVRVNETVRMHVAMKNKSPRALPMAIAIIGIPAGLSLQPWQLKEMQEKEVFDFYEITDGNLVVYYRAVEASATKVIELDLKADVPGEYKATASSAYLYYANEFKDWEAGAKVKIVPSL